MADVTTPHASDLSAALADVEFWQRTHEQWAAHFEAHPEVEAQYVATGEWDGAAEHRRIADQHGRVLRLLEALRGSPTLPAREAGAEGSTLARATAMYAEVDVVGIAGLLEDADADAGHIAALERMNTRQVEQIDALTARLAVAQEREKAILAYLFRVLPFKERHRWGGDAAEFAAGVTQSALTPATPTEGAA